CRAWDPAFAGELAVILDAGMREMLVEQRDVFHYITLMNENVAMPDLPEGAAEGVLRGAYRFARFGEGLPQRVVLMASGAIVGETLKAAQQLEAQGVGADVISVTSWSELARDGQRCDDSGTDTPWISQLLQQSPGRIVMASDYVRALPDSIRAWLPSERPCTTLGTDGFGRSDTRAALRVYFKVDAASIAQAALRG
ncbi:MAG: pyruvate dehydrogenase (acetyl-transferring), homodimeric type, partial [Hydrogenophaga sp.]|nr:pyruvate dehydrogenase (acetyl-transferring), homodimeric type [Hydrogenophaga sp.]